MDLRSDLLNRVKSQYEAGTMRPRLVEIFREADTVLAEPKTGWLFYAGMGMCDIHAADAQVVAASSALQAQGLLVPGFEETLYGHEYFRQLMHFDDVQWARDMHGQLLMYRLGEKSDDVLRPGARHAPAVKELEYRLQYKRAAEDDSFMLQGVGRVTPILTDERQAALRKRQHGLSLVPKSSYL